MPRWYEVEVTWPGVRDNWIVVTSGNTRRSAERWSRVKARDEFPDRKDPQARALRAVKGP